VVFEGQNSTNLQLVTELCKFLTEDES